MKVNILNKEKEKNSLEFEIEGEDHMLCNALRNILLEDESVEFVSYKIDHPTHADPIFFVKCSSSKTPTQALIEVSETLSARCDIFLKDFQKKISAQ